MAKIGLKNLVYKSAINAGKIAAAIQANIAITQSSVKLYADDAIRESDKSFQAGTITLGVDDLSDDVQAELLGKRYINGELKSNRDDEAPYVGVGFYGKKKVGGAYKWRAVWFTKVQFGEPTDDNQTKEEVIVFGTSSIVGDILLDDNGDWKDEQTFSTEGEAIAYINTKAGLPVEESSGLSGLTLTGTGGTLSPAFNSGVRYYTFDGVTASSVTVTATAAGHTINLYVDDVFVEKLTSGSASSAISVAVGSKKLTIVAYETGKTAQTTEIVAVKTA